MARAQLAKGGIVLCLLYGCSATDLAHDLTLDTVPTRVEFAAPVTARAGRISLCFEFARPGDSQDVSRLTISLENAAGALTPFESRADRTSENTVCLRGSVPTSQTYSSAILTAPRRIVVRRIQWPEA